MEVLIRKLQCVQNELEDVLRLEVDYEECKSDKYGKKLLNYIRRKRRIATTLTKMLQKYGEK